MKHYNNNSGYSIVISLLMVGFLIVVTSWVFNLVLWELNDNRGRENYLKAFAAAEWAQELALLQIKENGYGYYGDNAPLQYAIVPLFVLDDSTPNSRPNFINPNNPSEPLVFRLEDASDKLIWNMLSENAGMSGVGNFTEGTPSELSTTSGIQSGYLIDTFLNSRTNKLNYLILFNSDPVNDIRYNLISNREFTKPETTIISSAQVWKYQQNLSTTLDNTKFLNILRYSIYSN